MVRLILNGKKAGLKNVRTAVESARRLGTVEVRVTWEGGDVLRFVRDAVADGCPRIVAGGGDGTVKETVDALMRIPEKSRPEMAVLPLGTANDFGTACGISNESDEALDLAMKGEPRSVDVVSAGQEFFINIATGGFGAQVTASTPVALKNFLGGGAYTLSGMVQAVNFVPFKGSVRMPDRVMENEVVVGAVCNGSQAGGGQILAPDARIDDGILEVLSLRNFSIKDLGQVIREINDPGLNGEFVMRFRLPWIEWESEDYIPLNLDGEPIRTKSIRFESIPGALRLVVPDQCPLLGSP